MIYNKKDNELTNDKEVRIMFNIFNKTKEKEVKVFKYGQEFGTIGFFYKNKKDLLKQAQDLQDFYNRSNNGLTLGNVLAK